MPHKIYSINKEKLCKIGILLLKTIINKMKKKSLQGFKSRFEQAKI